MPMQFCEDHEIQKPDWALTEKVPAEKTAVSIGEADHWVGDGTIDKKPIASIENGRIRAVVNFAGVITFYRDGKQLLQEYFRFYEGTVSKESRCLKITSREWKGIIGGDESSLKVRFEAIPKRSSVWGSISSHILISRERSWSLPSAIRR